jgi:hypothetical protein
MGGGLTTLAFHFAWKMLRASAFEEFAASVWEGTVFRRAS